MALHIPVDTEVLSSLAFYATIVLLKTMFLTPLTSLMRFKKMAFANEEDAAKASQQNSRAKVTFTDPDVERYRRVHQNDLENVFPFVLIGLLYVLTGPDPLCALWHFRIFTGSRLLHTVIYLGKVPQPARVLVFLTGVGATYSMALQILVSVW